VRKIGIGWDLINKHEEDEGNPARIQGINPFGLVCDLSCETED